MRHVLGILATIVAENPEALSNGTLPAFSIDQLHGAGVGLLLPNLHMRTAVPGYGVMIISMWKDPADAEVTIAWTRRLSAAIEPIVSGSVNGAYEQRPFAAYGANYDHLAVIRPPTTRRASSTTTRK